MGFSSGRVGEEKAFNALFGFLTGIPHFGTLEGSSQFQNDKLLHQQDDSPVITGVMAVEVEEEEKEETGSTGLMQTM